MLAENQMMRDHPKRLRMGNDPTPNCCCKALQFDLGHRFFEWHERHAALGQFAQIVEVGWGLIGNKGPRAQRRGGLLAVPIAERDADSPASKIGHRRPVKGVAAAVVEQPVQPYKRGRIDEVPQTVGGRRPKDGGVVATAAGFFERPRPRQPDPLYAPAAASHGFFDQSGNRPGSARPTHGRHSPVAIASGDRSAAGLRPGDASAMAKDNRLRETARTARMRFILVGRRRQDKGCKPLAGAASSARLKLQRGNTWRPVPADFAPFCRQCPWRRPCCSAAWL